MTDCRQASTNQLYCFFEINIFDIKETVIYSHANILYIFSIFFFMKDDIQNVPLIHSYWKIFDLIKRENIVCCVG